MPCLNCISEKALREKSQKSKLECIASNVYQVIARYVEIEGEPCVIEMINRLDDETLMDSEGRQNLVSKLNSYSEELYRDADRSIQPPLLRRPDPGRQLLLRRSHDRSR